MFWSISCSAYGHNKYVGDAQLKGSNEVSLQFENYPNHCYFAMIYTVINYELITPLYDISAFDLLHYIDCIM